MHLHASTYVDNLLISNSSTSLEFPRPNMFLAVTLTVTLPTKSPTGSEPLNINVVVVLLTSVMLVPLYTSYNNGCSNGPLPTMTCCGK